MIKNNFQKIVQNWQFVLPPSRPSIIELERIRSLLTLVKRDSPVAVLGSTIEYRELYNDMGFQKVFIFEKNYDFYEWTKDWLSFKPVNENIIWGDWLDKVKEFKGVFSVVLSDLTMGNIRYEYREDFYIYIQFSLQRRSIYG